MMNKKQLCFSVLLALILGLYFSTQSRLPALNDKAQMAQRSDINGLAFDQIVQTPKAANFVEQWFGSSLNWYYTNWKGMTFGLLFASALLLVFQSLPRMPNSRFAFINSLQGAALGVPLGVCANCSTPVAYSMFQAGSRSEMALATLMSSPTLNVLVLGMSFSLLPFDLALMRLAFIALIILFFLPLLCHFFLGKKDVLAASQALSINAEQAMHCELDGAPQQIKPSWLSAAGDFIRQYLQTCYLLIRKTLPLMLVAGLLGGLFIELIDISTLSASFEQSSAPVLLLGLLVLAVFALLLPVPMAFDMVLVSALLASGLSLGFAAVLVFCLPIFSLYPALLLGRLLGWRFMASLMLIISLLAALMAFSYQYYAQQKQDALAQDLHNALMQAKQDQLQHIIQTRCKAAFASDTQACIQTAGAMYETHYQRLMTLAPADNCNQIDDIKSMQACFAQHQLAVLIQQVDSLQCSNLADTALQVHCQQLMIGKLARAEQAVLSLEQNSSKPSSASLNEMQPLSVDSSHSSHGSVRADNTDSVVSADNTKPLQFVRKPSANPQLDIQFAPYQATEHSQALADDTWFSADNMRFIASEMPAVPSLKVFFEPFLYGRGIAAGDYNQDGWPDVLLASEQGVHLYQNVAGQFYHQPIDHPALKQLDSFAASFVDFNNDTWLDIFVTAYDGRNAIVLSQAGKFDHAELIPLNTEANVALAAGFYDLNRDSLPDILLGNWTAGAHKNFAPTASQNSWYLSQGDSWLEFADKQLAGETLSVLFSRFYPKASQVGVVIANDEFAPDFYRQLDVGEKVRINAIQDLGLSVEQTSLTTMSLESFDVDNDGDLDLLTTDMSFASHPSRNYVNYLKPTHRHAYQALSNTWAKLKQRDSQACETPDLPNTQQTYQQCLSLLATMVAQSRLDPSLCQHIPASLNSERRLCHTLASPADKAELDLSAFIKQVHTNNLLINQTAQGEARFINQAQAMGIEKSFWSWNARAADYDNDGFQDVFIVNGYGLGLDKEIHANQFYRNIKGQRLERSDVGLEDFRNTSTYVHIDFDRDGDLDVISRPIFDQLAVYQNHSTNNTNPSNAITLQLRDELANYYCIGCQVIAHFADGSQQIHEVKASGGFLSFQSYELHIGLGQDKQLSDLSVMFSDEVSLALGQALKAGGLYRITRTQHLQQENK